jgi:hypothetical protein
MTKNKLAKQLIQKYSLHVIPEPWNTAAIRAIMEFSTLVSKHERKAVRAIARRNATELNEIIELNKIQAILDDYWENDR